MKNSIRITAAVALAAAATFALPVAAQADTIYPPSNACNVVPTVITPGATVTFSCTDGTFSPGEFVSVTVEGPTSAEVGFVRLAVTSTGSATSTSTGALTGVPITFPSNASGVYNITAVSETSAGGVASASVGTGSATGGSSSGSLPATGLDSGSLLGLWVGGGAIVLAGGALAVASTVRRNRKHADA